MPSRPTDDAVAVLAWTGEPDRVIQKPHWVLEDREDSTNQLRVTCSLAEADGIKEEQELIFKQRRFIVQQVRRVRSGDLAEITADEAQAELAGRVLEEFAPNAWTLDESLEELLAGTRWTIGHTVGVRAGRAQFEDLSVLEGLHFLARHQDARLSFDSLRRRVNIAPDMGTTHEVVFTYKRELTDIVKDSRAPITTVIYPTGADDLGIESENDGVPYVEDYGYYTSKGISLDDARAMYRKEDRWRDQRYEIAENLKRDAEKRLQDEAYPAITYELTAAATHSSYSDDFELSVLALGDQVYVWDDEVDAKLRAEVSVVTTSSDASENNLTLAYVPESLSERSEGTFFGDSGRPSDGPSSRPVDRSGPQPRPSMPILESLEAIGSGKVRWNGQDHEGSYDTIPERFGRVQSVVAALVDGVVPSPNGEDAFTGTDINARGGGISTISFGAGGEFAVWFQMVGRDNNTRSDFSEPLIVDVPDLVDAEQIRDDLDEAQQRINDARAEVDVAVQQVEDIQQQWDDIDLPELEQRINDATAAVEGWEQRLVDAEAALDAAEQGLVDNQVAVDDALTRLDDASESLETNEQLIQEAHQRVTEALDAVALADAWADMTRRRIGGLESRLSDMREQVERAEVRLEASESAINDAREDLDAVDWRSDDVAPRIAAALGQFLELQAEQIVAGEIDSDLINVNDLAARIATVIELNADRITAGSIGADRLDVNDLAVELAQVIQLNADSIIAGTIAAERLDINDIAARTASLISIHADQITSGIIDADRINVTDLAAELATVIELNASAITTGTLSAERLDAQEVAARIGTFLELTADNLAAGSVSAKHLTISNTENLWPDDWYGESAAGDYVYEANQVASNSTNVARFSADSPPAPSLWVPYSRLHGRRRWSINGSDGVQSIAFRHAPGRGITVKPGERYAIQTWVRDMSRNSLLEWQMQFYTLEGDEGSSFSDRVRLDLRGEVHSSDNTSGVTRTFEVPDLGWGTMYMVPFLRHGGANEYTGSGVRSVMEPILRKMVDGEVIVDGTVAARHIDVIDLFADQAFINELRAGAVEAIELTAERIITGDIIAAGTIDVSHLNVTSELTAEIANFLTVEADMIAANAIDSMTINSARIVGGEIESGSFTGGIFRTSSNWLGAGGAAISDNGSNGHFRATDASGRVVARLGGDRNELAYLDVTGELRVGAGGEGGIVPDGGRTRFVGRTPLTSSSEDTVAYGRTSATRFDPSQGANVYAITYETPTSPGSRVPICGVHINASVPGYPIPLVWNTRNRSSSGFNLLVHNAGLDYSPTIWIYYIAYWGEPPNSPITTG